MNNFFTRLSRRERLYVLLAAVILLAGGIFYPLFRAAQAYRQAKLEELESARSLCLGYQTLIRTEAQLKAENQALNETLNNSGGLLFERTGNEVMMEASMVKLLNQMAPDLGLDVSLVRSSARKTPGQLNFSVTGNGRYPEILNLVYQLEIHRPLIVVDRFNLTVQNIRRSFGQNNRPSGGPSGSTGGSTSGRSGFFSSQFSRRSTAADTPSEPRMRLQMDIHINVRPSEGGAK